MMLFWVTAVAMVITALAFVLTPLLRSQAVTITSRGALNIAMHEDRLKELESDLREGRMDQSYYTAAKRELERELLDDLGQAVPAIPARSSRSWWYSATAIALIVPVLATAGYWRLGNYALIDGQQSTQMRQMPTLDELAEQLARRVTQQPDDAPAWELLGQSYLAMERYSQAVDAYSRAYELVDDKPDLLAGYAEALSMVDEAGINGRAMEFINTALSLDPKQPKALWLSGIGAYQRGALEEAVGTWERLITLLPADSKNADTVNGAIVDIRRELAEKSLVSQTSQTPPATGRTSE